MPVPRGGHSRRGGAGGGLRRRGEHAPCPEDFSAAEGDEDDEPQPGHAVHRAGDVYRLGSRRGGLATMVQRAARASSHIAATGMKMRSKAGVSSTIPAIGPSTRATRSSPPARSRGAGVRGSADPDRHFDGERSRTGTAPARSARAAGGTSTPVKFHWGAHLRFQGSGPLACGVSPVSRGAESPGMPAPARR